jgi:hypothetical protein
MLLAFDYLFDQPGRRKSKHSAFHVPNLYAHTSVSRFRNRFEWIASIHPIDKHRLGNNALPRGARYNAPLIYACMTPL